MRNTRRIRLLIVDVDGTLLTDDHKITAASRAAVQQVVDRGVQVVLASARGPGALRGIMAILGINGLVIGYTGALTCRLSPDPRVPTEVVTECRMKLASAHDVLRRALEQGISVGWFTGDDWYIPRWDEAIRRESAIIDVVPVVAPDLFRFTEAPHKLLCIAGTAELVSHLHQVASTLPFDCLGQFSHPTYLEITHQGVDKATALLALGQQLGISSTAMVAIGDGANDITMLKMVAVGIAMGHAPPSVQAAADWVTDTNNRDGVAAAIERLQVTGWI
jgi:Cof subfamily protein (haloacid dehalogenase superfamily)